MHADLQEQTRRKFYADLRRLNISAPMDLFDFQLRLSSAIIEAELLPKNESGFNRHEFLLRRIQDSLAFCLLTAHSIRQLLGTASPSPHRIAGQTESFRVTQDVAARYASNGHLVLLGDLSNIMRLGDFIVCDNRAIPSIIEVKAGNVYAGRAMRGRRGRQAQRALTTIEYLESDHAHIFGQTLPKMAVQSFEATQFNWAIVEATATDALRDGVSVRRASEHDVFHCVFTPGLDRISGEPLRCDIERMRQPYFASHAFALLNPDRLAPPPLNWPIDDELAFLLMEEQLVLGHLIDLGRYTDPLEEGFKVLKASHEGFLTERHGEEGKASARFVDDVLFRYATIESTVAAMREMHDLCKTNFARIPPHPQRGKPAASQVEDPQVNFYDEPAAIVESRSSRLRITRTARTAFEAPAKVEEPRVPRK